MTFVTGINEQIIWNKKIVSTVVMIVILQLFYIDEKPFCCNGCKTVYEIFSENDLTCYYDLQASPGAIPKEIQGKYDFLSQQNIIEKLTEFNDGNIQIVSLYTFLIFIVVLAFGFRKPQ